MHVSHGHGHDDHDHDHDHDHDDDDISHNEVIWKATGVVAGVFIFYLIELVLHMLMDSTTKKAKNTKPRNEGDKAPLVVRL